MEELNSRWFPCFHKVHVHLFHSNLYESGQKEFDEYEECQTSYRFVLFKDPAEKHYEIKIGDKISWIKESDLQFPKSAL